MADVVKLKVAEIDRRTDEYTVKKYDEKTKEIRDFLEKNNSCGFVIAAYSKDGHGGLTSRATYSLHDAMDSYVIPEFLKANIERIREGGAEKD